MALLQHNRLRRIHDRALRAREKHPCLHFAAVTARDLDACAVVVDPTLPEDQWQFTLGWPSVPLDPTLPVEQQQFQTGLNSNWFSCLLKGVGSHESPMRETAWLHFDGALWQGEFFGVSVPGHNPVDRVPMERALLLSMSRPRRGELWPLCYAEGLEEFDGLAADAVANFVLPSVKLSFFDRFNRLERATLRWLGTLLGMDFVNEYEHEGWRVRQLPCDVFTASARAIEVLGAAETPVPAKPDKEAVSLTQEDMTILEAIKAEEPMAVVQQDLLEPTKLSLRTIRKRLKQLLEVKLVHKPHGPKKGYGLTAGGAAILKSRSR